MAASLPSWGGLFVGTEGDLICPGGRCRVVLADDSRIARGDDEALHFRRYGALIMIARVKGRLPSWLIDALLVVGVLVDGALELSLGPAEEPLQGVPLVLLMAAGLLVHRRFPTLALVFAYVGFTTINLADKDVADSIFGPFIALLYLTFNFSLHNEGRKLYLGALFVWSGGVVGTFTDQYDSGPGDIVFITLLTTAFPILAGQLFRSRQRLAVALREKADRLDAEREGSARLAAERERERIASELHDVVAHALGAMTIQASAARRLAAKDQERAESAFLAVEETGRAALTELRTILGVLRREDEELALAPQPSLAHISSLVRRVRAAGLPVELAITGEAPERVPAGVDLTAYRLVQEALGEAINQGAAGRAKVKVRYEPGAVGLEVTDDGGGDRRLLGMRERVGLVGGDLEAGPRRDGGHMVRVRLPIEAAS
jgi:signal transduction histidine kinase